ncbi:PhzF family phenazine biosynthesis isomerase [Jatrophihabitans sp. DSM 44399]|uniref:PhzF family phenazine biosynthesis isomerase n=1 Tax=Jatrophihabitans lederbergiae TaxID=3075547 RepID=A0ABU2J4X6_9ACTN|nr:PhzF family phenazine biosynthesis isomerase [Jatrophihabitans sp. DSM 44399]MDT0260032.1 PhzF family phenazine biosynthesis isomerase [Jatrophihabitans sp. DSM 44399]
MSELRLRTVDAFTDQAFAGNPAGVVVLTGLPTAKWMAALAGELNLAETAFVIAEELPDADYRLRWFTPAVEVDMCGHATLAAAHCLFEDGAASPVRFATRSGVLTVWALPDGSLAMDFPANAAVEIPLSEELAGRVEAALGARPVWLGRGGTDDLLVELADARTVRELAPDLAAVARFEVRGIIVTAAADADGHDFVSRFFGPRVGVPEDPVTGSAHTVLGPYWAAKLGRSELVGLQVSARSGVVGVSLRGDRVQLTGRAVSMLDARLAPAAMPASLPGASTLPRAST